MKDLETLSKKEIYRYLGYNEKQHTMTPEIEQMVDECIVEVLNAAGPRVICTPALPLKKGEDAIYIQQMALKGKDIRIHLEHCHSAVLMAVTLGTKLDMLIRRTEAIDMARAVILDAAANVAVEQAGQIAEDELREQIRSQGEYLTIRYSPGYGDLPITTQREMLRLTDAPRKIGLTVTASHIMTPRKSMTAIMGVADIDVKGKLAGCGNCVMRKKCIYRKRGMTCE